MVRQYIISVLSATIISALAVRFSGKQQATAGIVKLISAVFLLITAISPLVKFQLQDISDYVDMIDVDADNIITDAQSQAETETAAIITDRTQAYIKDKAATYGADVTVTVEISQPDSLIPDTITIEGEVSPYIKEVLQKTITDDLGIREDRQIWK